MADSRPLVLGSSLSNSQDARLGRLGAIARDGNGALFALTAQHVADADAHGQLLIGGVTVVEAGNPFPRDEGLEANAVREFAATISARRVVVADVSALSIAGPSVDFRPDDFDELIDSDVSIVIDGEIVEFGVVIAADGRAKVRDRLEGSVVSYSGAIIVEALKSGGYRPAAGDAGAPIVDRPGRRLIGLLVSGASDRYFVAPVAPFLRLHELSLWSLEPQELDGGGAFELADASASLRLVGESLTAWSEELRRTPSYYGGDEVFGDARLEETA